MVHLGNNIARLRGFKRLTQKELASKLNMRQQDYSKIENSASIDENLLEMIASVMDIPVELIRHLDGNSAISYNQQGGNTGSIFYQADTSEKIIEMYEKLLKVKDELLRQKDETIEALKKKQ
jgi:transcriptional regulator with XRE-family HTH domain